MALPHALPGQPIDVLPLGDRLGAEASIALFKSRQIEVMRLVLPAGKRMPSHKVEGEITLHCLEGRLNVSAEGGWTELGAGQLMYLTGGTVHAVTAIEDSSALLTIVLSN